MKIKIKPLQIKIIFTLKIILKIYLACGVPEPVPQSW